MVRERGGVLLVMVRKTVRGSYLGVGETEPGFEGLN
jgi:hypothetical protein